MKRPKIAALLSIAACATLALGLAACGERGEPPVVPPVTEPHTHAYGLDNACEVCGEAWKYTEGLTFAENGDGTLSVSGGDGVRGVVTIPYGHEGKAVTSVAASAFRGDRSLTGVVLGKNVTSVGDRAFDGCEKLVEVWNFSELRLEKGSRENGRVAYYAKQVYTKEEESKQTEADGYLFYEDGKENWLLAYTGEETQLTLPERTPGGNKYGLYGRALFGQTSLTEVALGDGVTEIGDYAFQGDDALTAVTFGKSVKTIGNSAFLSCDGIRQISLPENVTSIEGYAFNGCRALAEVTVGGGTIGMSAFESCSALTKLTLGAGVTQIGSYAFARCSALAGVEIPDRVTSIESNAFQSCRALATLTLGAGVRTIGECAFEGCTALSGVLKLPDRLNTIGKEAFSGCSGLEGVAVNAALTTVKAGAFSLCTSLARVEISDLAAWCTTTFEWLKGGDSNPLARAHHLYLNGEEVINLVIPAKVTKINDVVFEGGTSIESVSLESNVREIGARAFYGCTALTEIHYRGTTEAWQNVRKDPLAVWGIAAGYTVFCTDGTLTPNGDSQSLF